MYRNVQINQTHFAIYGNIIKLINNITEILSERNFAINTQPERGNMYFQ